MQPTHHHHLNHYVLFNHHILGTVAFHDNYDICADNDNIGPVCDDNNCVLNNDRSAAAHAH